MDDANLIFKMPEHAIDKCYEIGRLLKKHGIPKGFDEDNLEIEYKFTLVYLRDKKNGRVIHLDNGRLQPFY